jgi:methylphosphotriester-DNA--protein-cysteine methyltransferase
VQLLPLQHDTDGGQGGVDLRQRGSASTYGKKCRGPSYLLERAVGQLPMQYLTDWRMTLARERLLANELTIGQIAQRTGYSSPNAFAATFRRHVGLLPARWRQVATAKAHAAA